MKPNRLLSSLVALGAVALSHAGQVVLGKLGQATQATSIHASPSSRSRVFSQVKPAQYLVVQPSSRSGWLKVLLQKGTYGYVPASKVTQLPYKVTQTPPSTSSPLISRQPGRELVASRSGTTVARYALDFIGTPYKWGGNDLRNGIDCSGFVKQLYGGIGVDLPRTAAEQALVGKPITRYEDLRPGDRLYFWESKRGKIGHTGIYLGGGYFIHSSHGHGGVQRDYLTPSWQRILRAARR